MLNLLFLAVGLGLVSLARGAQTVSSQGGTIIYQCPDRATIESVYLPYCPSTSASGVALTGASGQVTYANAPNSYQTTTTSSLTVICAYGPKTGNQLQCTYYAGAGAGLKAYSYNNANCKPPKSTQPLQPSPGVNYRRREVAIVKRYDETIRYTCPFKSTTSTYPYLKTAAVADGTTTGSTAIDILYTCQIQTANGAGSTKSCQYRYDSDTGILTSNNGNPNGNPCPATLCNVIAPSGSQMKRGVFVENNAIQMRQVNTTELRRQQEMGKLKQRRTRVLRGP